MIVTLTGDQAHRACVAGVERRLAALEHHRQDAKGFRSRNPKSHPFEVDILGASAEYAVALALGVEWDPSIGPDRDVGDVLLEGNPIDVRATKYQSGCLLIHEGDLDDRIFVLVTGAVPNFLLRGWLYGGAGKVKKWLRTYDGRTSHWVPQSALNPINTLREAILDEPLPGYWPEGMAA